jgi:hypothetical protein
MEFFEPLWKNRIKLLHHTNNYYTQANNDKLMGSITWYCNNCHLLFAHQDTHLVDNIDTGTLFTMPQKQKPEWFGHFEIAKEAYEKKR